MGVGVTIALMYYGALSIRAEAWLLFPPSHQDHGERTNGPYDIRLFAHERRPGRPKTNPLSRDEQLRINKRNQLKRDKVRGLKRVELKLNAEAVEALNELAESRR